MASLVEQTTLTEIGNVVQDSLKLAEVLIYNEFVSCYTGKSTYWLKYVAMQ